MKRSLWLTGLFLAVAVNTGCVERRFLVQSDPPGAKLLVNGQEVGPTPADVYFTYYGKYHFTLIKDGYETLQVDQNIPSPWYEWFGVDFFSEAVYPFKVRDVRRFDYTLQSSQSVRPEDLVNRAEAVRARAAAIQPLPDALPLPPKPAPNPPTTPAAPPGPVVPPPPPPPADTQALPFGVPR
jgi:PEGA domain